MGPINYFKLFALSTALATRVVKFLSNIREAFLILEKSTPGLRFEPRPAGFEARMLPLCFVLPNLLKTLTNKLVNQQSIHLMNGKFYFAMTILSSTIATRQYQMESSFQAFHGYF